MSDEAAVVYNDGLVRAWEASPGWIAIEWLYPGNDPLKFGLTFRRLQKIIKTGGFKGWLAHAEKDHENMHRHLEKVGAKKYAENERFIFFKKEVGS